MRIATWNLNNRLGRVPFRKEAARAAAALDADVLVLTEYFPQAHHDAFVATLMAEGWSEPLMSWEPSAKANRVLITARVPVERDELSLPKLDQQFPANILAVRLPSSGLRLLGLRVPYYNGDTYARLRPSWEWIETTARCLLPEAAVIVGDLNVAVDSPVRRCGDVFRRILESGWQRAEPHGVGGYMRGRWHSEIDHLLASPGCVIRDARYVNTAGSFVLAGVGEALSDHSALVADVLPAHRAS